MTAPIQGGESTGEDMTRRIPTTAAPLLRRDTCSPPSITPGVADILTLAASPEVEGAWAHLEQAIELEESLTARLREAVHHRKFCEGRLARVERDAIRGAS